MRKKENPIRKTTTGKGANYRPTKSGAGMTAKGVRAAAHEDINLITLLVAGTRPGLEAKDKNGNWHQITTDPGTIIVNIGDMLKEVSGGYYP